MASALIIVDVQNDFVPGGALGVAGGDRIIDRINELAASGAYDVVIATRDWHPRDHRSFQPEGGPWPVHCVADTPGAELDPRLDRSHIDLVVDKGRDPDVEGYSGFEGTELARLLRDEGVDTVTVVGLATDYCVKHTALDGVRGGLAVTVDAEATAGVEAAAGDVEQALEELREAGVVIAGARAR